MATVDVESVSSGEPETTDTKTKATPQTKSVSSGVDIKKLLEAGAHFGHKTSRWHPKMAPYIHSKREGTHIIDLTKTVDALDRALDFLSETVGQGKQILLVSTKRQRRC
jgi:ribosomal protein S2